MDVLVIVKELSFDFEKHELGSLFSHMLVNDVDKRGYIGEIRDFRLNKHVSDIRFFDIYGKQNYFNSPYTSKESPNCINIIPNSINQLVKLVTDNKEKIVRQFLTNTYNSQLYYASVSRKDSELPSYLYKNEHGFYSNNYTPVLLPLKELLSTSESDNKKFFNEVDKITLYDFQNNSTPIVITKHEDIVKLIETPNFDIKFIE